MSRQIIAPIFICLSLIIGIFISAYRFMPQGIGESHDSVAYLRGAKGLINGEGYVHETFGNVEPNSHYPPGFSFSVACVAKVFQTNVQDAAKILNAFIFGLNAALFFLLLYGELKNIVIPILATIFFVWSRDILYVHFWAWSEPLFISGFLLNLIFWRNYLTNKKIYWLLLSGIITGLAILVRYAGLTLIPMGIFALILFPNTWKNKLKNIVIFTVPAILPYYLWGLRNKSLGQDALGRGFSVEWISSEKINESFNTITEWLFPANHILLSCVTIPLVIFFTYVVVRKFIKEKSWLPFICMTYFWGTYFFLIISISFFDHGTPLDRRILISHLVSISIAVFITIYPYFERNTKVKYVLYSFLALWFISVYGKNRWFLNKGLKDGHGLISWELRFREDVQKVTHLPENALIYAPEFQSVWLGRAADRKVYPLGLVQWLTKKDSIIYVDYFGELNYKPSFDFPIEQIDTLESGRLYKIKRKVD